MSLSKGQGRHTICNQLPTTNDQSAVKCLPVAVTQKMADQEEAPRYSPEIPSENLTQDEDKTLPKRVSVPYTCMHSAVDLTLH